MGAKGILAAILVFFGCAGAASCSSEYVDDLSGPSAGTDPVLHISEVGDSGLLGFEEEEAYTFALEILPNADENICTINAEYLLDGVLMERESLIPDDGSWFGPQNVILRAFSMENLEDRDEPPPFTVRMSFADSSGHIQKAENEFEIDHPGSYGTYLLVIRGSAEDGYQLTET